MKKATVICLLLALVLTLAGCQCKHKWVDATCEAPKTCKKCGQTEGEALGHSWLDATCQAPKTCATCALTEGEKTDHRWQAVTCEAPETCEMCGLTRGEALGHSWKEANYQAPETCATCGQTQGKPLEADFETHGIEINLWENKQMTTLENGEIQTTFTDPQEGFSYVTTCTYNKNKQTVGKLFLSNYRIFPSDETHQAMEGYEWRTVDAEIDFSDSNSRKYGPYVSQCAENYYCVADWDLSQRDLTDTPWAYLKKKVSWGDCYTASFQGEDYPIFVGGEKQKWSGWKVRVNPTDGTKEKYNTYTATCSVCVPVGYDGVVIGFVDSALEWGEDIHIYDMDQENILLFRMRSTAS